jgi:hypothetical protein
VVARLRVVPHALGEAIERNAVAPTGGALDDLGARERKSFGGAGPRAHSGEVPDDLKSPVWVTLGALELLSIDISRIGKRVARRPQRLPPALDLDRMRWAAAGGVLRRSQPASC